MKEILYAVLVLGIMGAVFGAVLAIASKTFEAMARCSPLPRRSSP